MRTEKECRELLNKLLVLARKDRTKTGATLQATLMGIRKTLKKLPPEKVQLVYETLRDISLGVK